MSIERRIALSSLVDNLVSLAEYLLSDRRHRSLSHFMFFGLALGFLLGCRRGLGAAFPNFFAADTMALL